MLQTVDITDGVIIFCLSVGTYRYLIISIICTKFSARDRHHHFTIRAWGQFSLNVTPSTSAFFDRMTLRHCLINGIGDADRYIVADPSS